MKRRLHRSNCVTPIHGPAFVAVEVTPAANANAPIEIATPSGYRVHVPRDFDAEHLRRVLEALERRC